MLSDSNFWTYCHHYLHLPFVHEIWGFYCIQNVDVYYMFKKKWCKTHSTTKDKTPDQTSLKPGFYWRAKWGACCSGKTQESWLSPSFVPQRRGGTPQRSLLPDLILSKGVAHKWQAPSWVFIKWPCVFCPSLPIVFMHREWRFLCLEVQGLKYLDSPLPLLWLLLVSFFVFATFLVFVFLNGYVLKMGKYCHWPGS